MSCGGPRFLVCHIYGTCRLTDTRRRGAAVAVQTQTTQTVTPKTEKKEKAIFSPSQKRGRKLSEKPSILNLDLTVKKGEFPTYLAFYECLLYTYFLRRLRSRSATDIHPSFSRNAVMFCPRAKRRKSERFKSDRVESSVVLRSCGHSSMSAPITNSPLH